MSNIVRNILRSSSIKSLFSTKGTISITNKQLSRSLWNTHARDLTAASAVTLRNCNSNKNLCGCNCSIHRNSHTKAESELVSFLAEEIVAEKQTQKLKTIPTEFEGFKVSLDGANVQLEKTNKNEKIKISFNINHTVDSDAEPQVDMNAEDVETGEMKSKPEFHIEIIRGNQTLSFTCSYSNDAKSNASDQNYNDIFVIDELALYSGPETENVYAVSGAILDGYLYDLLMNYLEEKGISNDFAAKLIELSTNYEHSAYISLLEGLSKFTTAQ